MTSDPDVFRAAKLLIERHSEDAASFVIGRVAELNANGDIEGAIIWRRILKAIEELKRGRQEGEPVN